MKLRTILIIAVSVFLIGLLIAVSVLSKRNKELRAEKERLTHNYKVVQDSVKTVKGENGLLARRIESESLTTKEIKTYYANLVADLADMKIQLRKVTGITAFNTETTNHINTFFRDSVRIDSVRLQTLSYSDRWFTIDIVKEGLKAKIKAVSRDSLIIAEHWQRTGKLWITRFLTKKVYLLDIKSMNPDSKITYSKWIIPYKKK